MNIIELRKRIKKEKIPLDSYSLDGGMPNDRYCLKKTSIGWEVYYSEMGKKHNVKKYLSEQEACNDLYSRLKKMTNLM